MFKRRFRLPSPALVISMITLSVVLGGTAVAASTAKHGDTKADTKLVKKLAPSLSVKHAKTANSATTATNATHATTADSATNATNATHATNADSATNATNATNATTVGGYLPSDLIRATSGSTTVNSDPATTASANIITGVNAPKAGGLLIDATLSCASFNGTTNTRWDWQPTVDGTSQGDTQVLFFPHANVSSEVGDTGSLSIFVPVAAGAHTVGYSATRNSGNGSLDCDIAASSLFVPFNNGGTSTARRTQASNANAGAMKQH